MTEEESVDILDEEYLFQGFSSDHFQRDSTKEFYGGRLHKAGIVLNELRKSKNFCFWHRAKGFLSVFHCFILVAIAVG